MNDKASSTTGHNAAVAAADQENAQRRDHRDASHDGMTDSERAMHEQPGDEVPSDQDEQPPTYAKSVGDVIAKAMAPMLTSRAGALERICTHLAIAGFMATRAKDDVERLALIGRAAAEFMSSVDAPASGVTIRSGMRPAVKAAATSMPAVVFWAASAFDDRPGE